MSENWRPVVGWEGIYEVSDLGRVRRAGRGVLTGGIDRYGYRFVDLNDHGRRQSARVHRLVGDAYLGPLPDGLETRHLNGDRTDNRLANLAYGTHSQNTLDMVAHGRHKSAAATHCPRGHAYADDNLVIDARGARNCRLCVNARSRSWQRKERARKVAAGEMFSHNVRAWGRQHGFLVADTGRIANGLLSAYLAAHPQSRAA